MTAEAKVSSVVTCQHDRIFGTTTELVGIHHSLELGHNHTRFELTFEIQNPSQSKLLKLRPLVDWFDYRKQIRVNLSNLSHSNISQKEKLLECLPDQTLEPILIEPKSSRSFTINLLQLFPDIFSYSPNKREEVFLDFYLLSGMEVIHPESTSREICSRITADHMTKKSIDFNPSDYNCYPTRENNRQNYLVIRQPFERMIIAARDSESNYIKLDETSIHFDPPIVDYDHTLTLDPKGIGFYILNFVNCQSRNPESITFRHLPPETRIEATLVIKNRFLTESCC